MSAKLLFGAALGCAMLVTPAFAQTTEPTSWRRPLPPKRQVNGAPPGRFFPIERTPPSKPHHRQGGNLKPRDRLGLQISSACDRRQADSIPDNFSSLTVFMHELRRIRTNNEIELINEVEPAVFEISFSSKIAPARSCGWTPVRFRRPHGVTQEKLPAASATTGRPVWTMNAAVRLCKAGWRRSKGNSRREEARALGSRCLPRSPSHEFFSYSLR
jgi:hypothetical protein